MQIKVWVCKICECQFDKKEAHGCLNKQGDWKCIIKTISDRKQIKKDE